MVFPRPRTNRSLSSQQVLHRTWASFEAFMAGFGSLYVVGGTRLLYSYGLYNGGPVALWTSMLVTVVLMCITGEFLSVASSHLCRAHFSIAFSQPPVSPRSVLRSLSVVLSISGRQNVVERNMDGSLDSSCKSFVPPHLLLHSNLTSNHVLARTGPRPHGRRLSRVTLKERRTSCSQNSPSSAPTSRGDSMASRFASVQFSGSAPSCSSSSPSCQT